jgi:hypothetical protein
MNALPPSPPIRPLPPSFSSERLDRQLCARLLLHFSSLVVWTGHVWHLERASCGVDDLVQVGESGGEGRREGGREDGREGGREGEVRPGHRPFSVGQS